MTLLALELNDAGLILARIAAGGESEILADSPGFALLEGDIVLTGGAAAARARQRPLFTHSTFWRELGVTPLPRPTAAAQTTADVAFTHLAELLKPLNSGAERLVIAVPAGYSRDQLGILIGMANEVGVPLAGLVDAGLAASSLEAAPRRVLHLDLELHRAALTALEHQGDGEGLRRSHFELQPRLGWLSLQQAWIEAIAETFVRRTRFDPLHQAVTEQALVDLLPRWLAVLKDAETVDAEMVFGGDTHRVELSREQIIDAVRPKYADMLRLVQSARPAGESVQLRLGQRLADLPGALEQFASLRDCELKVLPRGAAARGALLHAAHIERPVDALTLVYRLPVPFAAGAGLVTGPGDALPVADRPTHVLFSGRAWPITAEPLKVGWAVPEGHRSLAVPQGAPGVSRLHCTLVRAGGVTTLQDHSTYGTYVNDERVKGATVLRVGDRLRLGAPGVQLELIQLVNEHGAPSV